jgi:hypothetical protein
VNEIVAKTSPYRAKARRIRARLAHRPAAMHRALRRLNESPAGSVHQRAQVTRRCSVIDATASHAPAMFLQLVLDHLDGGLLRYSVRARLLRQAERLGIGRFEANLIIATAQHHRRGIASAAPPPERTPTGLLLAAAVLLQAGIVAGVWRLMAT